jgi:hypothetical protein
MPTYIIPNKDRTPEVKHSLGFYDQQFDRSKDRLEQLRNEVIKVNNTIEKADAPYQPATQ